MAVGYPLSRKYLLTHQAPFRFNENGEFRILHLSDIHKIHPEMQNELKYSDHAAEKSEKTLECIRKCVEEAKPNLVVFGGDYIQGYVHGWTYVMVYDSDACLVTTFVDDVKIAEVYADEEEKISSDFTFCVGGNWAQWDWFNGGNFDVVCEGFTGSVDEVKVIGDAVYDMAAIEALK